MAPTMRSSAEGFRKAEGAKAEFERACLEREEEARS